MISDCARGPGSAIRAVRLLFGAALAVVAAAAASVSAGERAPAWSGSDPLSMPYEIRARQLAKGNLAPNPSFEQPEHGVLERERSGMPAGWSKVGNRVEWIDRAAAGQDEVRHGRRAIRIQREKAGELDEAEGVISEFIPVIPGNYDFTYDVRLKSVSGSRPRFGGRLGDAVSVRLFFFDADQKAIDASAVNPVGGRMIDASDKSYSFANFWSIEDFPWATVRARTYNYPFAEGDLPERTRYVRIFFGLKGTGTLWLDNVIFRYSKWNFSALERLQPYLDRPLSPVETLIPTPKGVSPVREVAVCSPGRPDDAPPVIVLPEGPAPAERAAAGLLEETLNASLAQLKPTGSAAPAKAQIAAADFTARDQTARRLIFSIGATGLRSRLSPDLPLRSVSGKPQGYIIHPLEDGPRHVVFLLGETAVGTFYAAATAAQLIDQDRGVYHSAAVIDYPDFLGRSYLLSRWQRPADVERDLEGLEQMARYKLNKAYAGFQGRTKLWHRPDALFRLGVAAIGRRCRETGVMSLGMMVNPYAHFEFEPSESSLGPEDRYTWTHASEASLKALQAVFGLGLEAGADTLMLLADDFVPHADRNRKNYSLYTPEDRERFLNLQNAQAHVINRLKHWIDRSYPGVRFEFCPPWYNNEFIDRSEGKAEVYLRELAAQIPKEVALIWTGPTVRSLSVDMADLSRFRDLIGRAPMFWDNTPYARSVESTAYGGYTGHYPGRARLCNLFEPLEADRPAGFHELNHGRHMYVNAAAESEIYRIKFATIADYEWNTVAYDPEKSLWKALVRRFGAQAGRLILAFNDSYYGLYDVGMWMESSGVTPELFRRGEAFLAELQHSLASLMRLLPSEQGLLRELDELRSRAADRFERLSRAAPTGR